MNIQEKEQWLIRYDDLAPSLQAIINKKITKADWAASVNYLAEVVSKFNNSGTKNTRDVWVSIGKEVLVETNPLKNVHVDTDLTLPMATNNNGVFQNLVMYLE